MTEYAVSPTNATMNTINATACPTTNDDNPATITAMSAGPNQSPKVMPTYTTRGI